MIIKLSNLQSSKNTINKTFNNVLELDVTLRRGVDITRPSLMLSVANPQQYNYCFIPNLERYYFIDEIVSINKDIWNFRLSCDVIESFKNEILNSNARFFRNVKTGDYLDVSLESSIKKSIDVYHSDYGFDGERTMIITTIGNVGN